MAVPCPSAPPTVAEDGAAVRRSAPAKINLSLHITGRRDDGYHLLDTLVAFAAVGDELVARPAAKLTLAVDGPFAAGLDSGTDNLVWRAARLLDAPAALQLVKNLPVAAGLGGGSADAAATLLALDELTGRTRGLDELVRLGGGLGADVPMCLRGTPHRAIGIGDVLAGAVALPPLHIVLANPGVPLATPDVFRAWAQAGLPFTPYGGSPPSGVSLPDLISWLRQARNDLEPVARFLCPPVDDALRALAAQPGVLLARMTGSGATCFAMFASSFAAAQAATRLAKVPGWWVVATTVP
jgi:4-diphosphocytidyl-2-C-methyl-D-erythritol kinase